MHKSEVSIVLDSISPSGIRLTTFQLRYWRALHSELMTHRMFSRNAGSSRARPSKAIIDQVRNDPWGPLHWGRNQSGMQAHELLKASERVQAERAWMEAAVYAADSAQLMMEANAHKQIVNRLLEPFTYIDVVVTATDFANWFALRDHPDAQPEIRELAQQMRALYESSKPKLLKTGEWHLPYADSREDWEAAYEYDMANGGVGDEDAALALLKKASAARCARVSYKLFDGSNTNFDADIKLFNRLLVSQPLHASPAEHIASPDSKDEHGNWRNNALHGNLRGFVQFRKTLPHEFVYG